MGIYVHVGTSTEEDGGQAMQLHQWFAFGVNISSSLWRQRPGFPMPGWRRPGYWWRTGLAVVSSDVS